MLKRTKKLLKKIAEMLYKNCDKFGLTEQDEEVKELKELIDKMGEWGQEVKKRYSHKKMRAWSEYPLITRISFVLSCTALVLAIARLLLK